MNSPVSVCLVTPAPIDSLKGNSVSARRIAHLLRTAGYSVDLQHGYDGAPASVMIALHARRSAEAIAHYRERYPHGHLIVLLTGTDIYDDLPQHDPTAYRSLNLADTLVVAQAASLHDLPSRYHEKTRVISKSVTLPEDWSLTPPPDHFLTLIVGHLRAVKAPLLAATATHLLPTHSRLQLRQLGEALEPEYATLACEEMRTNPRYHWTGPVSFSAMWDELRHAHLALNTSHMEGGANSIAEAIAAGIPVLATDIPGNRGLLGPDYAGYFPVDDAPALAHLLSRAETDPTFYQHLRQDIIKLQPALAPAREQQVWVECILERYDS
jgi:putative glycosyltransferase (TIGR04348 family)